MDQELAGLLTVLAEMIVTTIGVVRQMSRPFEEMMTIKAVLMPLKG